MSDVIVVIPARGGSKRFPGKNIAPLLGRPLISYVIAAAKSASLVNGVYVSTEDKDIAEVAKNEGAIVPYMRPKELAGDTVTADEAVKHMVRYLLEKEKKSVSIVVLIQPTSPFVRPDHIDSAVKMFFEKPSLDSLTTLTELDHIDHPYNLSCFAEDGTWEFLFLEERSKATTRQAKPPFYKFGNLFAVRTETLLKYGRFGHSKGAVLIDAVYSWDIDYEWELKVAECMIERGMIDVI
jgi:CMP-N-acetylneuraminic acid synthetase